MSERHKNMLSFIMSEKFITLTVLGSIFTFAFISSMKGDIIDPLFNFFLPEENFGFMDVTIRDGESMPTISPKKIKLKFGNFFREFVTWTSFMFLLFFLARNTKFPDEPRGNPGVAIV